ncbi:MAG: cytochrome-c peroxidase [Dongiaceae bacterium]
MTDPNPRLIGRIAVAVKHDVAARLLNALLCVAAFAGAAAPAASQESTLAPADEPIAPIPRTVELDPAKVRLGERLFLDVRLSHGNSTACVSCHNLGRGGDDGQAQSNGVDGRPLDFNTPTVFNAALNFRLNWRGDFRTLEEQTEAALLSPRLMAAKWEDLLSKLRADRTYVEAFSAVYGGPPARPDVLDALVVFGRSLVTPDAPFDRYLRGDDDAIDAEEKRGYELFKSYGCVSCHQGMNVGGNLFQRFGIFRNPFTHRPVTDADLGRFALTGDPEDRLVFRVPGLRNVAATAPYFHDGSAATLEHAVAEMARLQLGRVLAPQEIRLIVRFLRTLTGKYGGRPVADPAETPP